MSPSFASQLHAGLFGESIVARWLIRKGYCVLPAYEVETQHGKGPRLFTASGQLISPDMLVFNSSRVFWCEAKTKSAFTWHRMSQSWQTGIDLRHWGHYLEVQKQTPWPVWILFLHRSGNQAKDSPKGCPSGLFANHIDRLRERIDHEHQNHGPSGMVYWRQESLKKIATFEEVNDLGTRERSMTEELHHNSPVRNCLNCAHRKTDFPVFGLECCVRTGWLCSTSVTMLDACGPTLRYWQPKPPRRSLRRWLMALLWE